MLCFVSIFPLSNLCLDTWTTHSKDDVSLDRSQRLRELDCEGRSNSNGIRELEKDQCGQRCLRL